MMSSIVAAPAAEAEDEDGERVAVAVQTRPPRSHGGQGQSWQPSASAGLCCAYSPALDAVVLHGGMMPGVGRSADLCIGRLERGEGDPAEAHVVAPALRWSKLSTDKAIPRRCFHASLLLTGASAGDQLLVFGGEGEPTRSALRPPGEKPDPALMNDLWLVDLANGRTSSLIPTSGAAPSPRMGHTLAALREPPAAPPKLAAGRMKKHGLSLIMSQRASQSNVGAGGIGGGPKLDRPVHSQFKPARPSSSVPKVGMSTSRGRSARGAAAWTVLAIGGRSSLPQELTPDEDAVHILKLTEGGESQWIPTMEYLSDAVRRRQQQERIRSQSNSMIVKAYEKSEEETTHGDGVAAGVAASKKGIDARRGMAVAAAKAAALAEADLSSACAAARASLGLLQRHSHSTVVAGSVAICFGGVHRARVSAHLVSVRFRDLAVSLLPAQGSPPSPRHSHAAVIGGGGMLISGGLDAGQIFDDVHHLSIPNLEWSTPRLDAHPTSDATSFLARHHHGMASISHDEMIVFGGYAAQSMQLGRSATGGFASNIPISVIHSSPRAVHASAHHTTLDGDGSEHVQPTPASTPLPLLNDALDALPRMHDLGPAIKRGGAPESSNVGPAVIDIDAKQSKPLTVPSEARSVVVQAIVNHTSALSSGFDAGEALPGEVDVAYTLDRDDEDEEEDVDEDEDELYGNATQVDDGRSGIRSGANDALIVTDLKLHISEASTSIAWLQEETGRLDTEIRRLQVLLQTETVECHRYLEEARTTCTHIDSLHSHIGHRTRAGHMVRSLLESAHVVTTQQINQSLAAVENMLKGEAAILRGGEHERIMSQVRIAADVWLRESQATATEIKLASEDDTGTVRAIGDSDEKAEIGAAGRAMRASAHTRGALTDRVNSSRLELAKLQVKLAHMTQAYRSERRSLIRAKRLQQSHMDAAKQDAADAVRARDIALAEIGDIISCEKQAEAALMDWKRYEDAQQQTTACADAIPSDAGGTQEDSESGLQAAPVGQGEVKAGEFEAMHQPGQAAASGSTEQAGSVAASKHTPANLPTAMSIADTAIMLAVQKVMAKRRQGGARWMDIIGAAKGRSVNEEAAVSDAAVIRQAERRLSQLRAELDTCKRAVNQSVAARHRVEMRLAKELYFQQLLGGPIPAQIDGTKLSTTVLTDGQNAAALKMNELRLEAQENAHNLHPEIHLSLCAREKEHSARTRAQIRGTVRRIMQRALDEPSDRAVLDCGENATPAVHHEDLQRPPGGSDWELSNLEGRLARKIKFEQESGKRRDLRAVLRAASCLEVMKSLPRGA